MNKTWWKNRIVGHGVSPANQFLAHPMNARRHPAKQREALRGSLNAVGWIAPVVVSAKTGKMLDGHARIEEALSRDEMMDIPFVEVEVSEDEERLILATLDPISALATYDKEALDALLHETSTGEAALQSLLSDLAEKHDLYFGDQSQPGAGGDDFDTTPVEDQTRVEYGDLWACGDHRVLCGDSTKAEDVARVMNGERSAASITDPPYNVGITYGGNYSDQQSSIAYQDFSRQWSGLALQYADCLVFTPGTGKGLVNFPLWFDIAMPYWMAIWVKKNTTTHSCIGGFQAWEPILIYNKPKKKIGQDIYDIPIGMQFHDGQPLNELHPTPKILKLWETLINDFTEAGDAVYEPFGGSGTTLVACERTRRKARVIELEPKFVNVNLSRWEAETGKTAQLIERVSK